MNVEEEYDKIYRYCYFKVRHRETAEDITQETFLRFWESETYRNRGQALRYLYTIARNLCIDEYRRPKTELLEEGECASVTEEDMTRKLAVRIALEGLAEPERELLLLRHVNEVPVSVLSGFYGISRFALYRRIQEAEKKLRKKLEEDSI